MSPAKRHTATFELLLLGAIITFATPAAASEPVRALFLGNSYTASLGGVPDLVERMAVAAGREPLEFERVSPGGFTLEDHFGDSAGSRTRITAGNQDWVVLQEQSLRPIVNREAFERFGRLLGAEIKTAGSRPLLFLTWARQTDPDSQEELTSAYCALADEIGAAIAPVGIAWELSLAARPQLPLHSADGSHPNDAGVYLAAAVFFRVLYGESPVGLPHDLSPSVQVNEEDALHLQSMAAAVVSGVGRHPLTGACAFGLGNKMFLRNERFRVNLTWKDFFGGEGSGKVVQLTDDGGYFWFFDPENPEVVVKVLDGRQVNGHFWVFYGALSNVEYILAVTDRETGDVRVYENPLGTLASFADTTAFRDDS